MIMSNILFVIFKMYLFIVCLKQSIPFKIRPDWQIQQDLCTKYF